MAAQVPVLPLFKDPWFRVLAVSLLASMFLVVPRIGESDAIEYYSYLPSLWFDGDLDFTNEYRHFYLEDPEGRAGFKKTFLDRSTPTGLKLNFGPVGSALLWSPFFLAAHAIVLIRESMGATVAIDGLSQTYRSAVTFGSALYGAIGLLLCYRLARRFAPPPLAFVAVVTLWWATPVAYYMYVAPGMSHAPSLFAVALFFTLWPWVESRFTSLWRWALWGMSAGLMALVREQDLLFAAAAALLAFSPKVAMGVFDRLRRLAVFGLASLVVFSPQFWIYMVLNGQPGPSHHVQDKMSWISPHALEVLFSPQHGLFFWSPILLFFVAGGLLFFRRDKTAAMIALTGFLLQVYISGAVESWTQAGAFGSRRFVGATVVFALMGAHFLRWLEPKIKTVGVFALSAFCILWNVSLMIQFGLGIMDRQRLVWSEILHNHVYEVPVRLGGVAKKFLFSPEALTESEPE